MGKQGRPFAVALPGMERRNAEMVWRYESGETLASIGTSLGFTRERVRQIVRESGVPMPWDFKCAVKHCQTSPRTPNRYCQAYQRRLDRYGDPLGAPPLRRDQHGTQACYRVGRCRCDLCRKANADRITENKHQRCGATSPEDPEALLAAEHRDEGRSPCPWKDVGAGTR